jgi:energy-coupling factor transporter ATP-binding protein EcfA2
LQKNEAELSLGQKQWISLSSRPFTIEPMVLLLDEPTAPLDPRQCDRLHKILDKLPKTTLVIASRQTDWLQSLCDQALGSPSTSRYKIG